MIVTTEYASPLGTLTLAAEGGALVGLWLPGQKHFMASMDGAARDDGAAPFEAARAWLDEYFAGEQPEISLPPLAPRGTAFQKRVWRALLRIPYGHTVTYGELARALHTSARAVGGAAGRNPISVIIPCHRVVGADGGLTGYAGGLENKRRLLALEGLGAPRPPQKRE